VERTFHVRLDPRDLPKSADAPHAEGDDLDGPTLLIDDLSDYLDRHARANLPGWPAADPSTIYLLVVPKAVQLAVPTNRLSGDPHVENACKQWFGAHSETNKYAPLVTLRYAVVNEGCGDLGVVTQAISHELTETATNPANNSLEQAWRGFDDDHLAYDLYWPQAWGAEGEVGDVCHFVQSIFVPPPSAVGPSITLPVQAIWSNLAVREGHCPCQPDPFSKHFGVPYFSVTPLHLQTIQVEVPQYLIPKDGVRTTKGYPIGADNTVDFEIGFFSDGPLRPWTVVPIEADPTVLGGTEVAPALRRTSITLGADDAQTFRGRNGDKVVVHVRFDPSRSAANPTLPVLIRFRNFLDVPDADLPAAVGGPDTLRSIHPPLVLLAPPHAPATAPTQGPTSGPRDGGASPP
jgi:hypothetical protein